METPNQTTVKVGQTIHIKAVTTLQDCLDRREYLADNVGRFVRQRLKELDTPQPLCGLQYGLFLCRYENPYDEIINMLNQASCILSDAWGFYFDTVQLRRELAELKGRTVEVVECVEVVVAERTNG